jgi:hypothetical protein
VKITALGRPIVPGYFTNKLIIILFFASLIAALAINIYQGEPFAAALISALSSAVMVFLSWAAGREFDPAHKWSAFIALPFIYIAFFASQPPSLLVLFFVILCCRFLNRTCGLQPLKSDALLLLVLAILLYFNSFYFALPYLVIIFLADALVKPANRFQYISALAGSAACMVLVLVIRPEFNVLTPAAMAIVYSFAAILMVVISAIYVFFTTRYDRVLDDLNKAELNYQRVNAARLLTAFWLASEIIGGGALALLQVYPVVLTYGGILLYHLTGLPGKQKRKGHPRAYP